MGGALLVWARTWVVGVYALAIQQFMLVEICVEDQVYVRRGAPCHFALK